MSLVDADLRRIARRSLASERSGHTLQPTALVHEVFRCLVDAREVVVVIVRSRGSTRPSWVLIAEIDEMNPSLAGLRGLQRERAGFSLTIDSPEPDSAPA